MQANLQHIAVPQSSLSQAVAANRAVPAEPRLNAPAAVIDTTEPVSELSQDELALMQVKQEAKVEYDRNTKDKQSAITQYLMTQHSAKREEIQQMVGIDLYA